MDNYIIINNQQIELTQEQVQKILDKYGIQQKELGAYQAGSVVRVGKFEMVVLEQRDGETALILKDTYGEDTAFGENNNYVGSAADKRCMEFEKELAERVGEENIVSHTVDLTSNDGLKCYGTTERKVSSLTADLYRKFVDILDTVKIDKWWWLATPWSTARHDNDRWILCVAPSGSICSVSYILVGGVRPFCILKSTIFVSG